MDAFFNTALCNNNVDFYEKFVLLKNMLLKKLLLKMEHLNGYIHPYNPCTQKLHKLYLISPITDRLSVLELNFWRDFRPVEIKRNQQNKGHVRGYKNNC
mgnify:CR=1 FL=1